MSKMRKLSLFFKKNIEFVQIVLYEKKSRKMLKAYNCIAQMRTSIINYRRWCNVVSCYKIRVYKLVITKHKVFFFLVL